MALHDNIKALRAKADIGQAEVAAALDVSIPIVSEWETGKKKPGRKNLIKLATFYRVTVEDLNKGEPVELDVHGAAPRIEKGLTQQQLADRLGSSQSQVDRLEKGQRGLTLDWARRLAAALDIDVNDLLRGELPNLSIGDPNYQKSLAAEAAEGGNKMVPVRHMSVGGQPFYFSLSDRVVGYLERPRGISPDEEVFAFYAPTDLMAPRWNKGEMVFVSKTAPATYGSYGLASASHLGLGQDAVIFGEFMSSVKPEFAERVENIIDHRRDADQDLTYEEFVAAFYGWVRAFHPPSTLERPLLRFELREAAFRWRVFDWPELL